MQANWSLFLNALLLSGVMVAIIRIVKARRRNDDVVTESHASLSEGQRPMIPDDIIAVRKIEPAIEDLVHSMQAGYEQGEERCAQYVSEAESVCNTAENSAAKSIDRVAHVPSGSSVMVFLLAKGNGQLAGYELLQTVLAAGLRFGEGNIFHRHQHPNGHGPILFSLAAATSTGTFDMQNIGAFRVHGLCIFMHASGNSTIDAERFHLMIETAKQLSEGLDTHMLDDKRQLWSSLSVQRYARSLDLVEVE